MSATLLDKPAACVLAALSKQECGGRESDTEARTAKLFGLNVSHYDGIDRGALTEGEACRRGVFLAVDGRCCG